MPMIYKRFTEKTAEEWRQIYKALQLLEFLVKNGSERVIDDARSHLSLLKMLRQFHYIDQNGKDQGINVRNRAKELADLLGDVDRIRAERKKAKATRNKYGGVEGGGGSIGGMSGGGGRYGGFGSEDAGYGGYSGGVYGDGGGFGGSSGGFQDSGSRRDRFEEYDEYDEGAVAAPSRRADSSSHPSNTRREMPSKKAEPPKKKEPEVDLFEFGDDDVSSSTTQQASNGKQPANSSLTDTFGGLQSGAAEDDDFDDFQSATPAPSTASNPATQAMPSITPVSTTSQSTQFAAPIPVSASQGANLNGLVGLQSPPQSNTTTPSNTSAFSPPAVAQQPPRPTGYQAAQPNYFTSVPLTSNQSSAGSASTGMTPGGMSSPPAGNKPMASKTSSSGGGDAFGSLWSNASVGIKKTGTPTQGPNLASMAKQKASAGIWGATPASTSSTPPSQSQQQSPRPTTTTTTTQPSQPGTQKIGGGLDDLLG
ncbi:MAG: Epsin-3, clathrin recruitment and traffic between the Golgi and endosome [Sclerophora amabilis]|nr:MAG: Epsin-3, clathrin recruitment and traffic between the Golgi and endosome [Sclerophora amabilis]